MLASGGIATATTDAQFAEALAPLAKTPLAHYLRRGPRIRQGAEARDAWRPDARWLLGALWSLRYDHARARRRASEARGRRAARDRRPRVRAPLDRRRGDRPALQRRARGRRRGVGLGRDRRLQEPRARAGRRRCSTIAASTTRGRAARRSSSPSSISTRCRRAYNIGAVHVQLLAPRSGRLAARLRDVARPRARGLQLRARDGARADAAQHQRDVDLPRCSRARSRARRQRRRAQARGRQPRSAISTASALTRRRSSSRCSRRRRRASCYQLAAQHGAAQGGIADALELAREGAGRGRGRGGRPRHRAQRATQIIDARAASSRCSRTGAARERRSTRAMTWGSRWRLIDPGNTDDRSPARRAAARGRRSAQARGASCRR